MRLADCDIPVAKRPAKWPLRCHWHWLALLMVSAAFTPTANVAPALAAETADAADDEFPSRENRQPARPQPAKSKSGSGRLTGGNPGKDAHDSSDIEQANLVDKSAKSLSGKKRGEILRASAEEEAPSDLNLDENLLDVRIEGNSTIPNADIAKHIKTRPGRPVTPKMIKDDVEALVRTRWFAAVEPYVRPTDEGNILIFRVLERPIVRRVEFRGNKKIKSSYFEKMTNLKPGSPFDVSANRECVRRIESHYHDKGYAFATVDLLKGADREDRDVVFEIYEGPKVAVTKVTFEGNKFFSDPILATKKRTKTRLLWLFGGKYDPSSAQDDIAALRQYYHSLGFFDVAIEPDPKFSEDKSKVVLNYKIDEGLRYKIRNVTVSGNEVFTRDQLLEKFRFKSGDFFNAKNLSEDVDKVRDKYGAQGRLFATVDAVPQYLEEPGVIDLDLRVREDQVYRIREFRVHIQGDHPHTRTHLVRNIARIHPGDLADPKKINATKVRVGGSQYFEGPGPNEPRFEISKVENSGWLRDRETVEVASARGQNLFDDTGTYFVTDFPDVSSFSAEELPHEREVRKQLEAGGGKDRSSLVPTSQIEADRSSPSPTPPTARTGPAPSSSPPHSSDSPFGYSRPAPPSEAKKPSTPAGPRTDSSTTGRPHNASKALLGPDGTNTASAGRFTSNGTASTAMPGTGLTSTDHVFAEHDAADAGASWPGGINNSRLPAGPQFAQLPQATRPIRQGRGNLEKLVPAVKPTNNEGVGLSLVSDNSWFYVDEAGASGAERPPVIRGQTRDMKLPQNYRDDVSNQGDPYGNPKRAPPDDLWRTMPPPQYIDVDAYLTESRTGRLMFGVGVNSNAGVVGNIVLSESNFDILRPPRSFEDIMNGTAWRGAGQRFRIEALPGNQVSRYMVDWSDPYFLDTDFNLGVSGFYYTRFFQSWTEYRYGGRVKLGRQLSQTWSAAAALRLEDVQIRNAPTVAPSILRQAEGSNFLSTIRLTLAHDTRDAPFLPSQGHFLEFAYEQAFGQFQYPRFEIEADQYFTMYRRPDGQGKHILTLHGQAGWTASDTPIFERFYAGGFQSFRGFRFRGVSPIDTGVLIGGQFMYLNSLEYSLPVTANEMLKVVAFTDFGTIQNDVGFNEFRASVGAGLRITVPAMGPAPIALDWAVPIRKQTSDVEQLFSFYIGVSR